MDSALEWGRWPECRAGLHAPYPSNHEIIPPCCLRWLSGLRCTGAGAEPRAPRAPGALEEVMSIPGNAASRDLAAPGQGVDACRVCNLPSVSATQCPVYV